MSLQVVAYLCETSVSVQSIGSVIEREFKSSSLTIACQVSVQIVIKDEKESDNGL